MADPLQDLILETASELPEIGAVEETVKWGQRSFAPKKPRIGSSVRIGKARSGDPALFFICHTGLVEKFREIYGDVLEFEDNRAILVKTDRSLPKAEIKHCVAMALTYHLRKD